MVWEIVIGVILIMAVLTGIREIWLKMARKKRVTSIDHGSHDNKGSELDIKPDINAPNVKKEDIFPPLGRY
jgi:hypothetical protein